jgi:hypothetical protein
MRRRIGLVAAVAVASAGCGGSTPHLARTDAAPLISLADKIAREGPCAQKIDLAAMRTKAVALVNRRAVPAGLQEPFLAAVNDLSSRTPACAPPPAPPPVAQPPAGPGSDHGNGHGYGRGHGRGQGQGQGDNGDEGDG